MIFDGFSFLFFNLSFLHNLGIFTSKYFIKELKYIQSACVCILFGWRKFVALLTFLLFSYGLMFIKFFFFFKPLLRWCSIK